MDAMHNELLTRSQVARRLGLSGERIRQLSISGQLPSQSTPLGRLYRSVDVEALAARRQQMAGGCSSRTGGGGGGDQPTS